MATKQVRKPLIAGNWKMNLGISEGLELALACSELAAEWPMLQLGIFPGMLEVGEIARTLPPASNFFVGAQNCYSKESGAFTGEVSPKQLQASDINKVLLGHSERRHVFGESDDLIAEKLSLALDCGMRVVLCVGETLEERQAGRESDRVSEQLAPLAEIDESQSSHLTVAYEPVWAIGTGETASPEQAQKMHAFIRETLDGFSGYRTTRIVYGGSVKGQNAKELAAQPDVEGFLIGGASLKIEDFRAIVENSANAW